MASTHPSLITSFFKSPAQKDRAQEERKDPCSAIAEDNHCLPESDFNGVTESSGPQPACNLTDAVCSNASHLSAESDDLSEAVVGRACGKDEGFAVNLCGLLTPGAVGRIAQTWQQRDQCSDSSLTGGPVEETVSVPCSTDSVLVNGMTTADHHPPELCSIPSQPGLQSIPVVPTPSQPTGLNPRQRTLSWDISKGTLHLASATPPPLAAPPEDGQRPGVSPGVETVQQVREEGEGCDLHGGVCAVDCGEGEEEKGEGEEEGGRRGERSRGDAVKEGSSEGTSEEKGGSEVEEVLTEGRRSTNCLDANSSFEEFVESRRGRGKVGERREGRDRAKRRGRKRKRETISSVPVKNKRSKRNSRLDEGAGKEVEEEEEHAVQSSEQLPSSTGEGEEGEEKGEGEEGEEKEEGEEGEEKEEGEEVVLISAGSQSDPNSGPETSSEVEITHTGWQSGSEAVVCSSPRSDPKGNSLDDSVVIITATTPPKKPSLVKLVSLPLAQPTNPSSSSLTSAWAKIFSKSNQQRLLPSRPVTAAEAPATADHRGAGLTSSRVPAVRSPKRARSASSSPHRHHSQSPRAPHSPKRGSPLRSPRRGLPCSASPLRSSLSAKKLLTYPQPTPRKSGSCYDHAPFAGLVHVRQENSDSFWNLKPTKLVLRSMATPPGLLTPPTDFKLPIQGTNGKASRCGHTPLLPISPDQRRELLGRLREAHPQERVGTIFERYCGLRQSEKQGQAPPTAPPPHPLPALTGSVQRARGRPRKPLTCSIRILSGRGAIEVDHSAYDHTPHPSRRKSLRLARKRSTSQDKEQPPPDLQPQGEKRRKTEASCHLPEAGVGGEQRSCAFLTDLWTELYQPQASGQVIGNRRGVQQLQNWLQQWKNKCSDRTNTSNPSCELAERVRKQLYLGTGKRDGVKRSRESSPTPEWVLRGEEDDFVSLSHLWRRKCARRVVNSSDSEEEGSVNGGGEEEEVDGEGVCPVLLLCGGEGWGKTAAVYACASELGFKVFEVNSTSVRSRQSLLSTLKEATLSHQVSTKARLPGSTSSSCSQPQTQAPRPATGQGSRGGGLLSFFKPQASGKKRRGGSEEREGSGRDGKTGTRKRSAGISEENSTHSAAQGGSLVSLATATVILLEEVDVLFDDDKGFWSGVYELIETTRRPIILTCNDSGYNLDCEHLKIIFEPPSLAELSLHMQLLCLSHDYHLTSEAAIKIATSLKCDIRHVFSSLQFWTTRVSATEPAPSVHHITGLPDRGCEGEEGTEGDAATGISLPPWTPILRRHEALVQRPARRDEGVYRELDTLSYCVEQLSYVDVVAMETEPRDCHVTCDIRPWWTCPIEGSLLDELPTGECDWAEREVNGALCDMVGRRAEEVGRLVRGDPQDPVAWTQLERRVQSVQQCLQQCSEVFAPHCGRVGVACDGLPLLRALCLMESVRESSNTKRRFRHYLQSSAVDQAELKSLALITRFSSPTQNDSS